MEDESDSGTSSIAFPFKRYNSSNSLYMTSSANTTDDEDSDMGLHINMKNRRREAHTQAEQKRRDAIKKGYDSLQDLVPMCQNAENGQGLKMSKATILQKTVDYIHFLQNCKKKQEEDVATLRKEAIAMTIMKLNYEQIVNAHKTQPGDLSQQVSDELKFEVFRTLIDSLFQTFDLCVATENFAEVSGSVIHWVEEHCKPQILREVMSGVLDQLQSQEDFLIPANDEDSLSLNPVTAASDSRVIDHPDATDPLETPEPPPYSAIEPTTSSSRNSYVGL